eukprot:scaffold535_cov260-Pinguiococcus_pyrenoidosus.AAC.26
MDLCYGGIFKFVKDEKYLEYWNPLNPLFSRPVESKVESRKLKVGSLRPYAAQDAYGKAPVDAVGRAKQSPFVAP